MRIPTVIIVTLVVSFCARATLGQTADARGLEKLRYNHPGLVVEQRERYRGDPEHMRSIVGRMVAPGEILGGKYQVERITLPFGKALR